MKLKRMEEICDNERMEKKGGDFPCQRFVEVGKTLHSDDFSRK